MVSLFGAGLFGWVFAAIGILSIQASQGSSTTQGNGTVLISLFGLLTGLVLGLAQWDVLRLQLPRLGGWLLVTTLGTVTGGLILQTLLFEPMRGIRGLFTAFGPVVLFWTGLGFWLGLWQARLLKPYLKRWPLWILASGTGTLLASEAAFGAILLFGWFNQRVVENTGKGEAMPWFISLGWIATVPLMMFLPGFVYGWVTSRVLARLNAL